MITQAVTDSLRRYMELREDRDTTKLAAEKAEEAYREKEAELYESLSESAVAGDIKVDLGDPWGVVRFGPRETFYGRVLDKELALDFFEQSARTDEFTSPKISAARVNELVRERIEAGQDMPPGIDWVPRRGVSISRSKR